MTEPSTPAAPVGGNRGRKPISDQALAFRAWLGPFLREHRKAHDLSAAQITGGLDPADVLKLERGELNPTLANLVDTLDGYGLRLAVVENDGTTHAQP